MVHWWQDPAIEACINGIRVDITFLALGAYGWEYFHTFGIEYAIIRRRLPFRWPLIPYILGRLSLLISLIVLAIKGGPLPVHFACQAETILTVTTGGTAVVASSTNFMIRTWVIWKGSRLVHALVLAAAIGHCIMLIIHWLNIKTTGSNGICVSYVTSTALNVGAYVYTMCYDFLVLVLCIIKLSGQSTMKSPLKDRLRSQHLFYFAVATMSNIPPLVFALLGSEAMVSLTSIFGTTASTVVSCRAVRSLLEPPKVHLCSHSECAEDGIALTTQFPLHASRGLDDDLPEDVTACSGMDKRTLC